ncbi:zinc finger CCCH domain-containing protein 34 isoform X2 [Diospyros lotus]|uniref:zinc finger CCCH domain-containing protein 34 isoform X2 n=1 Tax=Diospyros lotus TaxID=55363 RepID=UPI002259679B|nr:zinc finger CCCH domain-containing protein 34 isoform X2 [Diospyros lotus]
MEGSPSDLVMEWGSPEAETGLEEPMWQLGLGGGAEAYPERPGEADCMYYLRTGFCGYGARCRYNHPRDRGAVVGAMRAAGGEFPERVGQPICQFYMKTGLCKYGASCKYHHPRQGGGTAAPMALNIFGYPLRPGEKDCLYYVKTGNCKFGVTCKFHHPQPAGMQLPLPTPGPLPVLAPVHAPAFYPPAQPPSAPSSQQYGAVAGNWPVASPALVPGSNIQGAYSPMLLPPGMVPFSGWNPYQATVSPVASPSAQSTAGVAPIYGITQLSPSAPAYTGAYASLPSSAGPSSSSQKEQKFPERPGQPECQYYMKTGDCKYGSTCKYHHPPDWSTPSTNFALSPMGLPLRPGNAGCYLYFQLVCQSLALVSHKEHVGVYLIPTRASICTFTHPIGCTAVHALCSKWSMQIWALMQI